ncbi:hypothetical protein BO221_36205 [Archangium sp. Cb G35]|uniref:hypothetical protein n=1 Tax=Archangium sp. Cb G35 TaxID=1920190 RepID=UPI000935FE46|nr:hypothetical protein [Archangium sp. Cb G35]OJT18968.1 hypothetical protein BO221_36205 [Archangium sp. Cb G35]
MRKPTWWDLGIAVLGLVLVCSATQGVSLAQYPGAQSPEGPDPEGSVGEVTQDTRITGTSDGMGSDQGLPASTTTAQTGTGGSGVDAGQGGTGGSGMGYTGQDTGTGTQQLSALETQQRVEIARLRAQVVGLEKQLAQMRVNLARVQAGQGTGGQGAGTGGSGQETSTGGSATGSPAVGDPNAEAPTGATGVGSSTAEGVGGGGTTGTPTTGTPTTGTSTGTATNPSNEGYAVANVIHRGRVRSVTQQQLVLDEEDGGTTTLSLAKDVRVIQGRQQVSLKNLGEGTLVRTSADLYARGNPVTSIEVLSAPKKATSK